MVVDFDDFGANHVISDMCQSHDCRAKLDELHYANPNFKVTLFTIPGEMTPELLRWCKANEGWVELTAHGFYHGSNYECEKVTYEAFDALTIELMWPLVSFTKGFKSPGWQTSDDTFRWLGDSSWWISCQSYDVERLPHDLPAYVNHNGQFRVHYKGQISEEIPSHHGHVWNCVGNGIYEQFDLILAKIKDVSDFKFVSEVIMEFVDEVDSSKQG